MSHSVLITGATGFIGNALLKRLQKEGMDVTCLVRNTSRSHLPQEIKQIAVDAFTEHNIFSALENHSFEYVFHLAAYGVRPEDRAPLEMLQSNINATAALFLAAKEWPLKRFVYTGSCSEYGEIADSTYANENHPLKPQSLYGASKAAAGLYTLSLAQQLKLPLRLLRLFGVYGPGEAPYRLIPYLITLLKQKKMVDLTFGEQVRDFLYIDDVIHALLTAAFDNSLKTDEPYNICSSQPITIREIALQVAHALECEPHLLGFGKRPYRSDETMWMVGDNTSFRERTNWHPTVSLAQGIAKMITHYTDIL